MKKLIIFYVLLLSNISLYSQSFDFQVSYEIQDFLSTAEIDIIFNCRVKNNNDSVLIYKEIKQKKIKKPVFDDLFKEDIFDKHNALANVFFVINTDTVNVFKVGFFDKEIIKEISPNNSVPTLLIIPNYYINTLFPKYKEQYLTKQEFVKYLLENGTLYNIQGDEIYKLEMNKDWIIDWKSFDYVSQ